MLEVGLADLGAHVDTRCELRVVLAQLREDSILKLVNLGVFVAVLDHLLALFARASRQAEVGLDVKQGGQLSVKASLRQHHHIELGFAVDW